MDPSSHHISLHRPALRLPVYYFDRCLPTHQARMQFPIEKNSLKEKIGLQGFKPRNEGVRVRMLVGLEGRKFSIWRISEFEIDQLIDL